LLVLVEGNDSWTNFLQNAKDVPLPAIQFHSIFWVY